MKIMKKRRVLGFTMIELLVTTTIIAVLTAIGLVSFRTANMKARDGKRMADVEQIKAALEMYRSDNPTYPVRGGGAEVRSYFGNWSGFMNDLSGYIISEVSDPKNDTTYYYSYTALDLGVTYSLCRTLESDQVKNCTISP